MKTRFLATCLLASAALASAALVHSNAAGSAGAKPDIVLILMDDARLDDIPAAMPDVVRRIGQAGATFTSFYTSFPYCCPARATLLSGQLPHNHGVLSNEQ